MKNRHRWYPILLIGLILLLAGSLACCPEQITEDDLNANYQQGYDDGHSAGYEDGYHIGYNEGIDEDATQNQEAYNEGYYNGYQDAIDAITEIPADFEIPTIGDNEHDVADFFIEVISLTSPVSPGEYATIEVQTLPNELLTIEVWYMSGKSEAAGLVPKRANDEGYVWWTWKVGTRTTPGTWEIIIASLNFDWWFRGYENITQTVDFVVSDG
jgi:hypothetical protein